MVALEENMFAPEFAATLHYTDDLPRTNVNVKGPSPLRKDYSKRMESVLMLMIQLETLSSSKSCRLCFSQIIIKCYAHVWSIYSAARVRCLFIDRYFFLNNTFPSFHCHSQILNHHGCQ